MEGLNVTCLLTISQFFIATFNRMPKTSSVKIIELLLIKSTLEPTLIIITWILLQQTLEDDVKLAGQAWQELAPVPPKRPQKTQNMLLSLFADFILPGIGFTSDLLFTLVGFLHDFDPRRFDFLIQIHSPSFCLFMLS